MNLALKFLYSALVYLIVAAILGVLDLTGASFKAIHSHLMLAGFVSLTIVGAMFQLVPTILGTELKGRRLAECSFYLLNAGTILIALSMIGKAPIGLSGAVYTFGAVAFAIPILITVVTAKLRPSLSIWFFVTAIVYYLAGILYASLSLSGLLPFNVSAHAHVLTVGWVALTTFGGLYELFPMLSLRKLKSTKLAWLTFALSNFALLGIVYGFLASRSFLLIFGVLFALTFCIVAANLFLTLAAKSESKVELDVSVKFFVAALILGLAGVSIAPLNVYFDLSFQHSHLLLAGWIAVTIIGAEYHIIPMITWMEKFSDKLGSEDVPMIADLFSTKIVKTVLALSTLGTILLAIPTTSTVGGVALLVAFALFVADMLAVQFR